MAGLFPCDATFITCPVKIMKVSSKLLPMQNRDRHRSDLFLFSVL